MSWFYDKKNLDKIEPNHTSVIVDHYEWSYDDEKGWVKVWNFYDDVEVKD